MLARELLRKMDRVLLQTEFVAGESAPKNPIVLFFNWQYTRVYYFNRHCYFLGTDNYESPKWFVAAQLAITGANTDLNSTSFMNQLSHLNTINNWSYSSQYFIGKRFFANELSGYPAFMVRKPNPRGHPFYVELVDGYDFCDITESSDVPKLISDVDAQESAKQ